MGGRRERAGTRLLAQTTTRRDGERRGSHAHLERVVEIRIRKGVTVKIRHLPRARRQPPDPGAERERPGEAAAPLRAHVAAAAAAAKQIRVQLAGPPSRPCH
jgi:hypothetical protein